MRMQVGDEGMSLEQLAELIQVDASEIVRNLFMKGIMLAMNQVGLLSVGTDGGQWTMLAVCFFVSTSSYLSPDAEHATGCHHI